MRCFKYLCYFETMAMPISSSYRNLVSFIKRRRLQYAFTIVTSFLLLCIYLHVNQNANQNVNKMEILELDSFWTSEIRKIPEFHVEEIKKQLMEDLEILPQFIQHWPHNETITGTYFASFQQYPYKLTPRKMKSQESTYYSSMCPLALDKNSKGIPQGGAWSPVKCQSREHIAVIIPYRDRKKHLEQILEVLHPMLQQQQISYQIIVSEQHGTHTFNKGVLMDAAFLLATNISKFDCVIFHDVDLIPLNAENFYGCFPYSRHLSHTVNTLKNKLPYKSLMGGAIAFRTEDFLKINGYSTLFWGWGGEDDDMTNRIVVTNTKISRSKAEIGMYKMENHEKRSRNMLLYGLIRTARLRYKEDGLTSLKFRLISTDKNSLYTRFLIDVGVPSYVARNLTPIQRAKEPSKELMNLHFAIRDANDKLINVSELDPN